MASFFSFALVFGLTNVLYFMPEEMVNLVGLRPVATIWMNKLLLLVVLGACAMWIGYYSVLGRKLGLALSRSHLIGRWMSTSTRLNQWVLITFFLLSLVSRLTEIQLGIYGYGSDYNQLFARADYREYLALTSSLGKFALLGASMQCFSNPRSTLPDIMWLLFILTYEVVFGFISGFKGAVILPFLSVAVVYYCQRQKFPRWMIPSVIFAIFTSYLIIEPFRVARNESAGFSSTSLRSIVSTITNVGLGEKKESVAGTPISLQFLARTNLTYVASVGIEYEAEKQLSEDAPKFLENILLSPATAFIPRVLWSSKSMQTTGTWYNREVLGYEHLNAVGMSAFTYLNFAGGPIAVIIGFLVIGLIHRALFDGLRHFGSGGMMMLLGLIPTVVDIESAYYTVFISLFRFIPIFLFLQYFLLRHSHKGH